MYAHIKRGRKISEKEVFRKMKYFFTFTSEIGNEKTSLLYGWTSNPPLLSVIS